MSKATKKEKKLKRLNRGTTKTGQRNRQTKRGKALGSIKDPVSNLPIEINDLSVNVKKGKRLPRGGPMKIAINRCKLGNIMRRRHILRKQVQVANISRHNGDR